MQIATVGTMASNRQIRAISQPMVMAILGLLGVVPETPLVIFGLLGALSVARLT